MRNLRAGLGLTAALVGALAACAPIPYEAGPRAAHRPQSRQAPPIAGPAILPSDRFLQCVPYARALSGIWLQGDAHTWWTQAEGRYPRAGAPEPGAVLVLKGYNDPSRGHLAVVTSIVSEREILVDQANWLNQGEISVRVPVIDVSPANDWTEVRVWHIPSGDWGVRIYRAEGFILPSPTA